MKLYEFEAFPNPRRVRMFLAEKGVSIDRVQVNVPEGEHRTDAIRAKNPSATVPFLELEDGSCISECAAISRFVEAKHPEPALLGATPAEQGKVDMWQRRVEEGLLNAILTYFHHATPGLGALELYQNKDWGEKNRERAADTLRFLDRELTNRSYVAGDSYSIADITALCGVDFCKYVELDIPEDCPNLKRWYDDVSARPSAAA